MRIAAFLASSMLAGLAYASTPEIRELELRSMSIGENARSAADALSDLVVDCFPQVHEPGAVQRCTVYAKPYTEYSSRGLKEFDFRVDPNGNVEAVSQTQHVNGFDDTLEALKAKFGAPSSDDASERQTAFGVRLDQRTVVWIRAGSRLTFIKRLNANESVIDLRRELSEAEERKAREERVQRAAEKI